MTIQQEACEKIMRLPEDGIRLILVMADEIAKQHGIFPDTNVETEAGTQLTRKKRAFQDMLELREQSTYPKNFDYKKTMEDAIQNLSFRDFEDCLQDECAVHVNAEYIVTCNKKDFKHAKTPTVTPDVFLKIITDN